jgi:hypothetical protein
VLINSATLQVLLDEMSPIRRWRPEIDKWTSPYAAP